MAPKAELLPPSAFSEPSEPSQIKPEDSPRKQLTGAQEENPQLIAHNPGKQGADRGRNHHSASERAGQGRDREDSERKAPETADGRTSKAYNEMSKKGGYVGGKL